MLRVSRSPRTNSGVAPVIVMPTTAPELKVNAVAARGAEIVLHGESYSEAYEHAQHLMHDGDLTFVHPFDDPDVIAGQGTIGMEILRQHGRPIHAIFVAIGGGGLIAGIAAYVKRVRPDIRVIGVQHIESDAMARSVAAGERVELAEVGLFSDGTAVKSVGEETFRLVRRARRRHPDRRHRRNVRGDQGRVHRHADVARTGGCPRDRRD